MNSGLAGAASRDCTAVSSYAHVKHASDQVWGRWERGGGGGEGVYKLYSQNVILFQCSSLCKLGCLICTSYFYFLSYINRLIAVLF